MKKILITGGSSGIGEACVKAYSNGENKVAFTYNTSEEKAQLLKKEYNAIPIRANLSSIEPARYVAKKALEELSGIDILINNVGEAHVGLFNDITDDTWIHLLNVNLSSAVLISRDLSREMIRNHNGRIINVGSVWGRCGASCEVAYSATKSALRGFTMALAKELGPSGITVNCVEPGVINTPMNKCFDGDAMKALAYETPLCRIGEPHEVAALIKFLSSESASFITGQCIGIDGGFGL